MRDSRAFIHKPACMKHDYNKLFVLRPQQQFTREHLKGSADGMHEVCCAESIRVLALLFAFQLVTGMLCRVSVPRIW
jgi:hypothetical protein